MRRDTWFVFMLCFTLAVSAASVSMMLATIAGTR